MSLFEWAVLMHLSGDKPKAPPTEQTQILNGTAVWSALFLIAALWAFFKSWSFLAAILLGISVFVFWYGFLLALTASSSPRNRQMILSVGLVFLVFTIPAVGIYLFTDMAWLFHPIFWTGIGICAIYLFGKR